jgi:hypothetical protein
MEEHLDPASDHPEREKEAFKNYVRVVAEGTGYSA